MLIVHLNMLHEATRNIFSPSKSPPPPAFCQNLWKLLLWCNRILFLIDVLIVLDLYSYEICVKNVHFRPFNVTEWRFDQQKIEFNYRKTVKNCLFPWVRTRLFIVQSVWLSAWKSIMKETLFCSLDYWPKLSRVIFVKLSQQLPPLCHSILTTNAYLAAGCHFKKQYVEIRKTIEDESYDCYPTTPVLRCLDECQATKTKTSLFPMTCVKTGSKESTKIFKEMEKRTLDLTGSEVYYTQNLSEDVECDCSVCGQ